MSTRNITFRADEEVFAALARLEPLVPAAALRHAGKKGVRSIVIREAILEKAARVAEGSRAARVGKGPDPAPPAPAGPKTGRARNE